MLRIFFEGKKKLFLLEILQETDREAEQDEHMLSENNQMRTVNDEDSLQIYRQMTLLVVDLGPSLGNTCGQWAVYSLVQCGGPRVR